MVHARAFRGAPVVQQGMLSASAISDSACQYLRPTASWVFTAGSRDSHQHHLLVPGRSMYGQRGGRRSRAACAWRHWGGAQGGKTQKEKERGRVREKSGSPGSRACVRRLWAISWRCRGGGGPRTGGPRGGVASPWHGEPWRAGGRGERPCREGIGQDHKHRRDGARRGRAGLRERAAPILKGARLPGCGPSEARA